MTALLTAILSSPTVLAVMGGVISTLVALFVGNSRGANREKGKQAMEERNARETAFRVEDKVDYMTAAERRERLARWARR